MRYTLLLRILNYLGNQHTNCPLADEIHFVAEDIKLPREPAYKLSSS